MKVYRSKSDEPKKKMNKKMWISIGVSLALIAAAVAITLSLTLGGGTLKPDPGKQTGGAPVYVMPIDTYEVGKTFANDKLVKYYTSGWYETHEGLDFLAETGTQVKSIVDGTILSVEVGTSQEGTVIKIQHSDGVVSVYKGLGSSVEVSVGDKVESGDVIGTVGRMPIEAREYEEAHLHLEVYKNGAKVNPLEYLPEIGDK